MTTPKVAAALELDPFSLSYRVQMTPAEAAEFMHRAATYNNSADCRTLAAMVAKVDARMPHLFYYNDHPSHGAAIHSYYVGIENSRVLYVELIKTYSYGPAPIDFTQLGHDLAAIGRQAHADECMVTENDAYTFMFRFWWD